MADHKITLTRAVIVGGAQKTLQSEVTLDNLPRNLPPIALVEGIDKLLKQATELVPDEARKYWNECRSSGHLQLYEIQSELETRWGITFGAQEVNGEPSPQPQTHRNGSAEPPEEVADLDSMLKNQLKVLQARNAALNASIDKMTAERDKNDANIMRIAQFLGPPTLKVPELLDKVVNPILAKKRGRKPKEQPHAE